MTTDASCGAVNGMHDSFTPLGGMMPLINIMLGEVVFGGVGAGLYGVVVFVILAVFIAGLMVGRTPEYLGKKIESYDVQMAMLSILVMTFAILGFSAFRGGEAVRHLEHLQPGTARTCRRFCTPTLRRWATTARRSPGLNANTLWYNTSGAVGHAAGPVLHAHSDPGHRRKSGEEKDLARIGWHVSGDRLAVRGACWSPRS